MKSAANRCSGLGLVFSAAADGRVKAAGIIFSAADRAEVSENLVYSAVESAARDQRTHHAIGHKITTVATDDVDAFVEVILCILQPQAALVVDLEFQRLVVRGAEHQRRANSLKGRGAPSRSRRAPPRGCSC